MATNFEQLIFEIIATDKNASAAFDRFRQKVDQTSRSVDQSTSKLDKNAESIDKVGKSADKAAGAGGIASLIGGGGAGGGGMAGLVAAAIATSPYLITLGTGLGGIALAALAAGKNSAQLKAELVPLKAQFAQFNRELQPTLVNDFAGAVRLAGHLLHDITPLTQATGKALAGMLSALDREFQNGQWQSFFQFLAREAGPDIHNLTGLFVNLTMALPPLVRALQPLADELVHDTSGVAALISKLASATTTVEHWGQKTNAAGQQAQHTGGILGYLAGKVKDAFNAFDPGISQLGHIRNLLQEYGKQSANAATAQHSLAAATKLTLDPADKAAAAAWHATQVYQQEAKQLNILAGAYTNALTPLENYIGAQITQRQDLKALNDALKLSHDRIGLKTVAEQNSFNAAETYIRQTVATGDAALAAHKGIDAQITSIRNALPELERVRGKTADYKRELDLLKGILDKLRAERKIDERVVVTGQGSWRLANITTTGPQGMGVGRAAGWRVPGYGGGDRVPALLEGGEAVVPKHLTTALAPFLKAHGVPGFAAGGIVPSYGGPVAGLAPWTSRNQQATLVAIGTGIGQAMAAGFRAVISAAAGPGGGSASANAALARSMYPAWGSGAEWAAWNYVAMRESGWNQFAYNPSGATGIPQALPYTKMPRAAWLPWQGGSANPRAQIGWMIGYIASTYGDPVRAAQHEAAFNWYDRGGWLPPGLSLAYNGTGRPEAVGGGGTVINITVQVGHGTHPVAAAQEIIKLLNLGAKSGVKLRTSILGPG